jgi:hypothetical protein
MFIKKSKGFFFFFVNLQEEASVWNTVAETVAFQCTQWQYGRVSGVCAVCSCCRVHGLLTVQQNCYTNLATRAISNMDICGTNNFARFEVFTRVQMKIQVFRDTTPCPWVFPDI